MALYRTEDHLHMGFILASGIYFDLVLARREGISNARRILD